MDPDGFSPEHTEQAVIASLPQLLEQMQNEAEQTRREWNVRPILARIEELHAEANVEEAFVTNLLRDLPGVGTASDGWVGMPDANEVTCRAARMRREETELREIVSALMSSDDGLSTSRARAEVHIASCTEHWAQ